MTYEEAENKFLDHAYNTDFCWDKFRLEAIANNAWANGMLTTLADMPVPDPSLVDFSYLKKYINDNNL